MAKLLTRLGQRPAVHVLVPVGAVLLAFGIRLLLAPVLHESHVFLFFTAAVLIAAGIGGLGSRLNLIMWCAQTPCRAH